MTSSFMMEKRICRRLPASGKVSMPYFSPRQETTAFLTMLWQAGTLCSVELME